ncbi:MATE family efflux transporter [Hyalangium rubrum]|uniref:Multidrug-efflux transporter n=1 Tax=Hyalangium rubrum TaxID=3103134 RepID=A0ABU5HDH8_9BACT|nr:MATE family efflux transporter [Hyalangium sp. s54d21]MDY7230155.1 MATE family efflux transporter [Hyalangium sp. s54d21]
MAETPPTKAEQPQSLWASLKESLHGSDQDFTEGPLGRAIFLLSVPMVLETVMESIFAVVDVFLVGRLGPDAVATVGLTESMLVLIYAVALGLSIGATAMVARRIGEKDPEQAARTAVQAIGLGVLLGVPLSLAGAFFARPLLALMGGSSWVLEHGVHYTQITLASMSSVVLLFLINAIFRGAGDAAIAMRVLWLANILNIILAPCFIFGWGPFPELGVTGAAVGTSLGRTLGVVYQLYRLSRGSGHLRVRREHLRLEPGTMLAMLRLSGLGMFQAFVSTTSWLVLARIVSSFGSTAIAGYTIAMRIILFALLPSWGLGNAAATLVGQSLGAKKPERGAQAVWTAARYNMIFLGSQGVLFIIFARPIIGLFTQDEASAAYGVQCLRIVSAGFLFYAFGMVLEQAFNGAGDTTTPTLINISCFWVVELPLAWVLAHTAGMGPTGAFLSVTISYGLLAMVSIVLFRRGRWKLRTV